VTRALLFVEIDLPYCALTYGITPCAAALGVTGPIKCFNTLKTCQDPEHFTNAPVTLRFSKPCDYLPRDVFSIPSIVSDDFTPGTVSLGVDLGERATLTINFRDHPWSDTGVGGDKYIAERGYDAYKRGTFWGKFRARQPYVRGRPLRLIRGFEGQAIEEMDTRHYVIDSFDGPRPDGTFSIVAKDVLKLASDDRAKAPRLSNGRLNAGIAANATSFTLAPALIGNLEYPTSGLMNLSGKEIVAFTRSGDTVTLTQRGQWGTTAIAHSAGGRAQVCLHYDGVDPADILNDLLTNYAGVSPTFIPLDSWKEITATYLGNVYTALIPEPTGVETLCNEIIKQGCLVTGWDDANQRIPLDVLRNVLPNAAKFSERNSLRGTLRTREQPDKRVSQAVIYFGMRNPLVSLDSPDNYQCTHLVAALESEGYYGSAAIETTYSRWIPFAGRELAERLGKIIVSRFQDPPRRVNFNIFREGVGITPAIMGSYRFEYGGGQDATGAPAEIPAQITRLKPTAEWFECEAEEALFKGIDPVDVKNRVLTIDSDQFNVNVRAVHDTVYPPVTSEDVANGVNLTVIVAQGATVASTAAGRAGIALDFGPASTWPGGFQIRVRIAGAVRGKGGKGGTGANQNAADATAGEVGGTAIRTRHPLVIELPSTGQIKSGGGGGGGGPSRNVNVSGRIAYCPGGGGGGGAGITVTAGGIGGFGYRSGSQGSEGKAETGGAGGVGGRGEINGTEYPASGGTGGNGGAPGQAGAMSVSAGAYAAGGAAGYSIDGISYCTFETNLGVRAGPTAN